MFVVLLLQQWKPTFSFFIAIIYQQVQHIQDALIDFGIGQGKSVHVDNEEPT